MARKPRIHFSGALYHVTLRGNGGQQLFFDEEDGQEFRALVAEGLERFDHTLLAYCFMPSEVHMLIEVGDVSLSKIMQNLSFRYTRFINDKLGREGHLFGGRYKALLIDGEKYLLPCVRTIQMKPVDAGLAKSAGDWLWSSHRSYLRPSPSNIVVHDKVMTRLYADVSRQNAAYEDFMKGRFKVVWPPEDIRGEIIGDATFIAKVTGDVPSDSPQYVKRTASQLFDLAEGVLGVSRAELKGPSRARDITYKRGVFAKAVQEACGYSIAEIAKGLNRDGSSLGRLVHKMDSAVPDVAALKAAILAAE